MIETLSGLPAPLVLIVATVLLFAESGLVVGIVLPGAGLVLSLGLLSGLGVVDLASTVVTVTAATLLGSQFAFLSARHRDPAGFGLVRRHAKPVLARSSRFLERNPAVGVVTGRLVGGVRTVVPIVAAQAGVRHGQFLAADAPTALGWTGLLVTLGHLAGSALDQVRVVVGLVGLPLVLLWLAIHYWRKYTCARTPMLPTP
jgi:membrane-associated protein